METKFFPQIKDIPHFAGKKTIKIIQWGTKPDGQFGTLEVSVENVTYEKLTEIDRGLMNRIKVHYVTYEYSCLQIEDKHEGLSFAIGDTVLFTNDYGNMFGPFQVTGFLEEGKPDSVNRNFYDRGFRYYLNKDCYWFPVKESSLTRVVTFDEEFELLTSGTLF